MSIPGMLPLYPEESDNAKITLCAADEGAEHPAVLLHELTASGVLIESEHRFFVDQIIELISEPKARWRGRIVWAGDSLYECRFNTEIEANALAVLLANDRSRNDLREALANAHAEESLGARLQRLRIRRGLTQFELAEMLGVSPVAVSYWESDRSTPRRHRTKEISKILGVAEEELSIAPEHQDEVLSDAITASKSRIARILDIDPSKIRISFEM